MRILHITDTHLTTGQGLHHGVPTSAHLQAVIESASWQDPADVIVVSGDISDDGAADTYEFARSTIGALATAWHCPVVWTPGNHDQGAGIDALGDIRRTVTDIPGLRIIAADTSVVNKGYGTVGDHLEWLAGVVDSAPAKVCLVLHHPPATPPTVLHGALRLADAEDLVAFLADHPVDLIVSGHYHMARTAYIGTIPIFIGAAVANETTTSHGTLWESAIVSASYGIIDVGETITRRTFTVPVDRAGEQIFLMPPKTVVNIGQLAGRPGWSETDPLVIDGIS